MDETINPPADPPPAVHTYDMRSGGQVVPVPLDDETYVALLTTAEASETTPRRWRSNLLADTDVTISTSAGASETTPRRWRSDLPGATVVDMETTVEASETTPFRR
eukprot:16419135-Heterocapsa_arctica.AAC.1